MQLNTIIANTNNPKLQAIGEKVLHNERITPEEGILLFEEGELPFFYEGFESVRGLLGNPPLTTGAGRDWTDKRFPEWIKAWHEVADESMRPQIPM
ncbi:MAG: hypothetical protein MUF12_02110 [Sediminibacterium sp.]|nr:hypothetical protein [Sediminibacterium sp.]